MPKLSGFLQVFYGFNSSLIWRFQALKFSFGVDILVVLGHLFQILGEILFNFLVTLVATFGLYYNHVMIVNDDSSVVSKWSIKLIDDDRVVIYGRNSFIIQAMDEISVATSATRLGEIRHLGYFRLLFTEQIFA